MMFISHVGGDFGAEIVLVVLCDELLLLLVVGGGLLVLEMSGMIRWFLMRLLTGHIVVLVMV